jgi:hypothetical protein
MSIRVPHANMGESMESESTSYSSLSLLCQLLDQILPFASSRINMLFPSFGIYRIIVANRLQSSPNSNRRHRSSGLNHAVLNAWENGMSMGVPHAHEYPMRI